MSRVTVEGLKELETRLLEIEKVSTRKGLARRVLTKAGKPMAEKAQRLAPDDPVTPPIDLHTSIEISRKQKSGRQTKFTREGPRSVEVHIGPTKDGYPQAIMQEFGTVNHPAQPYMRPAWDSEARPTLDRIKAFLGQEITKTAKRLAKKAAKG